MFGLCCQAGWSRGSRAGRSAYSVASISPHAKRRQHWCMPENPSSPQCRALPHGQCPDRAVPCCSAPAVAVPSGFRLHIASLVTFRAVLVARRHRTTDGPSTVGSASTMHQQMCAQEQGEEQTPADGGHVASSRKSARQAAAPVMCAERCGRVIENGLKGSLRGTEVTRAPSRAPRSAASRARTSPLPPGCARAPRTAETALVGPRRG